MELELRIISLQGLHFNYTCLLQHRQTQIVILNIFSVLQHTGDSTNYVNQVVSLVIYFINFCTCLGKSTFEAEFHYILYSVWVWLVTNFKHVILCYLFIKSCSCCL